MKAVQLLSLHCTMRMLFSKLICLVIPAMLYSILASGQVNILPDKNTSATLELFRKQYVQSMLSQNAQMVLDHYGDNIRLMPEFQPTIKGKENASLYFNAVFKRDTIQHYQRSMIEILDLDSMVVELGYMDMKFQNKQSQKIYTIKGKYQDIWQRSKNGQLTLVTEAWNYNDPIDFADQFRFNEVPSVRMAFEQHLPVNSNISFELASLGALMANTIQQKDDKIWTQFFCDDGMFIYSSNPIYHGKKDLATYLAKHVIEMPVFEKLDIRNDEIHDLENGYVIEYATHIANWRSGESSGISTGKNIRIWRREPNGTLKIFRQMAMYD